MRASRFALVAILVSALAPALVRANRPHASERVAPGGEALLSPLARVYQSSGDFAWSTERAAKDPVHQAFLAEAGGEWVARYDRRTGTPALVWGSGLPAYPGRGNDLTWADVGLDAAPAGRADMLGFLEGWSRQFMARHAGLFRLAESKAELVLSPVGSGTLKNRPIWYLAFEVRRNGVPVRNATVVFRFHSGNLVQFGAALVADALATTPTTPELSDADAVAMTLEALAAAFTVSGGTTDVPVVPVELSEVVEPGELVVVPFADDPAPFAYRGAPGRGVDYRLAWRVVVRVDGHHETWTSYHDAVTGERIALFDDNKYACPLPSVPQGRVTGGVLLGPIEEVSEEVRGLPFADVRNGGDVTADFNGNFLLDPAQPAETGLDGAFFNTNCVNCVNPEQALVRKEGTGELFLGFGGLDEQGNGFSTSSERNTHYHLNVVRRIAEKYLDDADVGGFFSRNLDTNVNIEQTCNAFWDGNSVNFFRSGGGCNNSGDIADVIAHEWGHGIDQATGNGDGARGEGVGDITAFMETHDPRNAPYFFVGQPFEMQRHADETAPGIPFKTASNITSVCPGGGGPFGAQIHCEAGIWSQTVWRLGVTLRTNYGERAGWYIVERLYFQSLPISDTFVPDQTTSTYDAFVLVDDDDGDLMAIPHGTEINDAHVAHEIASTPQVPDGPECTPLTAPALNLTKLTDPMTENPQVNVTWANVPGAVSYELYRNDTDGNQGEVPVAILFPPQVGYLDDNVTDGVTYHYRMQVFDATGCFSLDDNQQSILVDPVTHLSLSDMRFDDTGPMGNGNGIPEPGEEISLPVDVLNIRGGVATGTFVTVSTTDPRITIVQDTTTIGNVMPGEILTSPDPQLVIQLDSSIDCNEVLKLEFELEAMEGCSRDSRSFVTGLVSLQPRTEDTFETAATWTVDPVGADTATEGIWELADPIGSFAQLEDDHTPTGTMAWITGNDEQGGFMGADEVDDGCTTLQSRTYDLGGQTGLTLSYWRYWARIFGGGEDFLIEISNDGGQSWMELERITDAITDWRQAIFLLDDVLGEPADRVVVRFNACDLGGGSFLEAGVDDFSIGDVLTTCEEPIRRPVLSSAATIVGDSVIFGALGNDNGRMDPGERVKLVIDLENTGNADATNVQGTATILSAPVGVNPLDVDTSWPDIVIGAVERSGSEPSPHFVFSLTRPDLDCGGELELQLDVTYEGGPQGPYALQEVLVIPIGEPGGSAVIEAANEDFEVDDGGFVSSAPRGTDDWELGTPAPAGMGSVWDPVDCASGMTCWGTDLGNVTNGDYDANSITYLEMPSLDLSGMSNVQLQFWRWLTVEDGWFDRAVITVNGAEVWSNPVGGGDDHLIDTEWTLQRVDISAEAAGNADVVIRFEIHANETVELGGWTLDDVTVFEGEAACTGILGCEIFPAPGDLGAVLRATGAKDDDGAEFEWAAARLEPSAHYRLFRGTSPDNVRTWITTDGFMDLSFDDRNARGPLYFYQIKQADCAGVVGP